MIKEALFPQVPIQEEDDPQIELHPCVTSLITDLPQAYQDRINSLNGSRRAENKKFKLGNKVVTK